MYRVVVATVVLATLLVAGVDGGVSIEAGQAQPRIVSVTPNPTATGDAGERLVVSFPRPTDVDGWAVADGETVVRLPNRTVSGRVVLTTDPEAVPGPPGNATVVALRGYLALSNEGETIELRSPGGAVDAVSYRDAPEGERYVRAGDGWEWRTPGATDRPVVAATGVPARLFVLPDDPETPLAAVAGARERVLLAAYTFSSFPVADALCDARERGVRVVVLVEGEPVGGTTRRGARTLDGLEACDVDVRALGGPGDRYAVHHPKYAVIDDGALVLTENWKPAGTGGRSSRGWGVVIDSPAIARALAETFRADAGFRDARPWSEVRADRAFAEEPAANGSYPARIPPERLHVDRVELLVAPDNAEARLIDLLDGAEASVRVQQVSIGGRDDPFLNATLRAARRGVSVRVLLSGAWYVEEENRRLVDWLEGIARQEGLPLQARLARPRSRFEKTHTKGLIVDGEAVAVGSLNWNRHAARENREVVVVLYDPEAAAYYGRAFRTDWRGGAWRLPAGFGAVTALASVLAGTILRRTVRFDRRTSARFDQGVS